MGPLKEIFVALIWFYARTTLESQPPLFQGTGFAFGDSLVLIVGLLGLASLVKGAFAEI